jgi:hypothetical protein
MERIIEWTKHLSVTPLGAERPQPVQMEPAKEPPSESLAVPPGARPAGDAGSSISPEERNRLTQEMLTKCEAFDYGLVPDNHMAQAWLKKKQRYPYLREAWDSALEAVPKPAKEDNTLPRLVTSMMNQFDKIRTGQE